MKKPTPTIGAQLWYRPADSEVGEHGLALSDQPLAATVAYVHSDDLVNLMVIEANGCTHARQNVPIVLGDDEPAGAFAEWPGPDDKGKSRKKA